MATLDNTRRTIHSDRVSNAHSYAVAQSYHVRECKRRSKEHARLKKWIADLSLDKGSENRQELRKRN